MRTALIVPKGSREVLQDSWDLEDDPYPHVDFVTEDLAGFLKAVKGALA
jgi:putative hydrolase of the HAD superfamily